MNFMTKWLNCNMVLIQQGYNFIISNP